MRKKSILIVIILLLVVIAASYFVISEKWDKEKAYVKDEILLLKPSDVKLESKRIFMDPIKENIQIIELGSDNIAVWAKNGIRDKTLVLVDSMFNIQYELKRDYILEAKNLIDNNDYETLANYTGLTNKLKRLYDQYNYIYAAHRLGIIKRVVWIIPVSESLTSDYIYYFMDRLREDRSFTFSDSDIASFTFSNNRLEGSLFGIPITVTTIGDLELYDEPVLLSINLAYLMSFVIDNVKTPIEDISVSFLLALKKKPLLTDYITIVNSNKTFDVPLQFRFLSVIFKEFFESPYLTEQPKEEWIIRQQADKKLAFVDYKGAEADYNTIIKMSPEDPSTYYQLAILNTKEYEFNKASDYIEQAMKYDENYVLGYVDLSTQLSNEDKQLEILNLGIEKHPNDIPILSSIAGLFYKKGKYQESLDTYLKLKSLGLESYDLNFYIADCYFNLKKYEKAKAAYDNTFSIISEDFKLYYSFFYINMGETYLKLGEKENAIRSFELFLKYNKNSPNSKTIELRINQLKKEK